MVQFGSFLEGELRFLFFFEGEVAGGGVVVRELRHFVRLPDDQSEASQGFQVLLRLVIGVSHLVREIPRPSHAACGVVSFLEVGKCLAETLPAVQGVADQSGYVCALVLAEVDSFGENDWGVLN